MLLTLLAVGALTKRVQLKNKVFVVQLLTMTRDTQQKVEELENKVATLETLIERFIPTDDEGEYTEKFKRKVEQSWQEKEAGDVEPLA
jgi:hypothetical protein